MIFFFWLFFSLFREVRVSITTRSEAKCLSEFRRGTHLLKRPYQRSDGTKYRCWSSETPFGSVIFVLLWLFFSGLRAFFFHLLTISPFFPSSFFLYRVQPNSSKKISYFLFLLFPSFPTPPAVSAVVTSPILRAARSIELKIGVHLNEILN